MTLQEFLNKITNNILSAKDGIEVKRIINDAKQTLERSNITEADKRWFWDQAQERIKHNDILLKEAQAAAALNDLVALALATIQQITSDNSNNK